MKHSPVIFLFLAVAALEGRLQAQVSGNAPAGTNQDASAAAELQGLHADCNRTAYAHNHSTDPSERTRLAAHANDLSAMLLEFAASHPGTPLALDSLTQVVTQEYWLDKYTEFPGNGTESRQGQAIAAILRDYLESDRIEEAVKRIHYGFRRECESFLRTVLEKSPHRRVRGITCLRLAQFLATRQETVRLLAGQPELTKRHESLYGKDYLDALRGADTTEVMHEAETLYKQAASQYGDVTLEDATTVARMVETDLFDLKNLSVGSKALELAGTDQDGVNFKLTDYRGKAVLIYFWSEY